jgi:hypothetical protein
LLFLKEDWLPYALQTGIEQLFLQNKKEEEVSFSKFKEGLFFGFNYPPRYHFPLPLALLLPLLTPFVLTTQRPTSPVSSGFVVVLFSSRVLFLSLLLHLFFALSLVIFGLPLVSEEPPASFFAWPRWIPYQEILDSLLHPCQRDGRGGEGEGEEERERGGRVLVGSERIGVSSLFVSHHKEKQLILERNRLLWDENKNEGEGEEHYKLVQRGEVDAKEGRGEEQVQEQEGFEEEKCRVACEENGVDGLEVVW